MHLHIYFRTSSVSLFFIFYHTHVNVWLDSHSHSNGFVLWNSHWTNANFYWLCRIPSFNQEWVTWHWWIGEIGCYSAVTWIVWQYTGTRLHHRDFNDFNDCLRPVFSLFVCMTWRFIRPFVRCLFTLVVYSGREVLLFWTDWNMNCQFKQENTFGTLMIFHFPFEYGMMCRG